MSHITLRGYWYDIIVPDVYVPTEDKSDDTKDNFIRDESFYLINSLSTI
jgi:hypothetical protein